MSSSTVIIQCPECEARISVSEKLVGKVSKCQNCQRAFFLNKDLIINGHDKVNDASKSHKPVNGHPMVALPIPEDTGDLQSTLQLYKSQNLAYQKEVLRLKKKLNESGESGASNTSIEGMDTLALRVSDDNKIVYANTPFCDHFSVNKGDLVDNDLSILRKIMDDNLYKCIRKPVPGPTSSAIVSDQNSRHFEIKVTAIENGMDVVLHDVTNEQRFKKYVQRYVSEELVAYSEEDLSTFKYPERRFMTVSFTDLRDFTLLTETMKPEEVRSTMNAYLEDIIHAIKSNNATVDKIVGDEVMALFGAPRYYEDHALRAIKTACDQMTNLKALQASFARFGKHIPDCGIGINSGDMVVGNMGCTARQDYTVLGSAVNLAARLCGAARGSEIILTESTLRSAIKSLPEGWSAVETTLKHEDRPMEVKNKTEGVYPLPENLSDRAVLVGPDVKNQLANWVYKFTYLYSIKVKGIKHPLPIISVVSQSKKSLLRLDNSRIAKAKNEPFFGKYKLMEKVGRGGMGEVWKARDNFGNIVALKMLIAGDGASIKQVKRFKREAEIMSKLQHRNICHIYEVGVVDQRAFIAMEFVEGVTLGHILKYAGGQAGSSIRQRRSQPADFKQLIERVREERERPAHAANGGKKSEHFHVLPVDQTLDMIIRCCDAIQYAHDNGILHRDIKPANIMIRPNGDPVLMDFGLARMDTETHDGMSLSLSGQIIGTIEYMAPEQAQSSKNTSEKSDVYSLGAILYQMLAGRKHFISSGNVLADSNALQNYQAPRIRSYNKRVERDLETITFKALRSDPFERYQTVDALMTDLQRYQAGLHITAKDLGALKVLGKILERNKTISIIIMLSISAILYILVVSWISALGKEKKALLEAEEARNAQAEAHKANEESIKTLSELKLQRHISEEAIAKFKGEIDARERELAILKAEKDKAEKALRTSQEYARKLEAQKQSQDQAQILLQLAERAESLSRNGDLSQAEFLVDELLAKKEDHIRALLLKCNFHLLAGQYPQARTLLKKIIQQDPEQSLAREMYNLISVEEKINKDIFLESMIHLQMKMEMFAFIHPALVPQAEQLKFWKLRLNQAQSGLGDKLTADDKGDWTLDLSRTQFASLKSLAGIKVRRILARDMKCGDFSFLQNTGVSELNLSGVAIQSLDPLKSLALKALNISHTAVTDLAPLKSMPLKTLDISHTKVQDLGPIAGMPILDLNVAYTNIKDIRALSQHKMLQFDRLDLSHTAITSLEPLQGVHVQNLNISSCNEISDLSPLKESGLVQLHMAQSGVKRLDALAGMKLKKISLSRGNFSPKGLDLLKGMSSLEEIGDGEDPKKMMPTGYFWSEQ